MPQTPTLEKLGVIPALWSLLALFGSMESRGSHSENAHPVSLVASSEPGWPQFRGPRRDGRSDELGLLQSWPPAGPSKLWSVNGLGKGYSSPIIVHGKIYITGDLNEELHVFCLDESDGNLLWKKTAGRSWKNPYPGARATVTYSAGRIHLLNAHGQLWTWDAQTGDTVWTIDVLKDFGGKNITWGMSECLLADQQAIYVTAGGTVALVVALDKKTGEILWKSSPLSDSEGEKAPENASYVSPILVEFAGRRLLVGCSLRHLYCIDAKTGIIQWTRRLPTAYSVLAMMPVLVGDNIFMTAPHGKPGRLLQLLPPEKPGGNVRFQEKWETSLDTCQGGVVHHQGKLVGSFYPGRKGWAAVDANNGEILYRSEDIVKGAVLYADQRFYVLSENGWMRLLEAGQDKFTTHGQFRLVHADNNAWAHPVILNHRLFLRYQEELFCFDIKQM